MKETIKLGLILLIISVASAGVLAVSNNLTKDKIAAQAMEGSIAALNEVFGEGKEFKYSEKQEAIIEANPSVIEIFEAYEGETLTGYAIKSITKGFAGDVTILTGFSTDSQVLGMRVLEHGETKGLGSKAADPEYTTLYVGKDASAEVVVDSISGATVTSKAVLSGVNAAREIFNSQLSN